MKRLLPLITLSLGVALAWGTLSGSAAADVVPLADGRMIHGEIVDTDITEEGLAVRTFETGGTVLVEWKHIEPTRRKELRVLYGLDAPEDETVVIQGHLLTLTNGGKVKGVIESADGAAEIALRTATGVRRFSSDGVAKREVLEIDITEIYSPKQIYQMRIDQVGEPQTAVQHFEMGDYCSRVGAHAEAKKHFEEAAKDPDFKKTADGKSLEARTQRADILIRAEGAEELVRKITRAMGQDKHNDSLALLLELDETYQDPQIRKAVGLERLETRVVRARDTYFKARIAVSVYRTMEKLIEKKVKEKKSLRPEDSDDALAGTVAGAKNWAARELPKLLWEGVGDDLGLETEEIDTYWRLRTIRKTRRALYGTGSFVVSKSKTKTGDSGPRRRRPPGSRGGGGGGPAPAESKPLTDQEWWESVRPGDRGRWLEAFFVETSGIFEVIRVDENDHCSGCAGRGYTLVTGTDGGESQRFCPQCNGVGTFRTVIYK